MNEYAQVTAIYRPTRTDDLKPGAAALIGQTLAFMAADVIESGAYAGQQRFNNITPAEASFAWAPACDIEIVEQLTNGIERSAPPDKTDWVKREFEHFRRTGRMWTEFEKRMDYEFGPDQPASFGGLRNP